MRHENREFREETLLNSAEERLLVYCKGRLGLSASGTLRYALLRLGDDLVRQERLSETGGASELLR